MKRTLLTAILGAAAIALLTTGGGNAAVNPHRATTIKLVSTNTSLHMPPNGPAAGETITFTTALTAHGHSAGTAQAACVMVTNTVAQCQVHSVLRRGDIYALGPLDLAASSSQAAIVGGTGAYATARGYIQRTLDSQTQSQLTFHVTT